MGLRRGFKKEANWYAREMRRELSLTPQCPLCPWKLAEHLDFRLSSLRAFEALVPEEIAYLRSAPGQTDFSAITLFYGSVRWIIYNDGHARKRQAADIAHELAHGLLMHPPKPPFDAQGSRHYDAVKEEEANWLGPALLISDEAAVWIVEEGMSVLDASNHYAASTQVVRMRLNVSGAAVRVARRRAA
ncbi:ImmA/IrrE family metallo-endopeptidase [Methylobacterium sp. WL30]|uniref:ImmA/IrrE family metallo-endopeptidase n=2 Tax=Methylobacterium TaxID=407 RepID=UPI0011CA13EE|nr:MULTISPECIES: ImmA/IrrE family metallo-endopeptidase [unclassified Methylobacterium]TXN33421.1 ImmA/IrrE family metallo-endopeptidase [Methylobacterium sp. WL93]TXN51803.1 ImmA/IrrE family metallo-endopeptidase [Methylobacterium sp. WL119]TXN70289.1 ImmA/IrrE family metallo-endopeptidase [Methylobacterium sp. WL30]